MFQERVRIFISKINNSDFSSIQVYWGLLKDDEKDEVRRILSRQASSVTNIVLSDEKIQRIKDYLRIQNKRTYDEIFPESQEPTVQKEEEKPQMSETKATMQEIINLLLAQQEKNQSVRATDEMPSPDPSATPKSAEARQINQTAAIWGKVVKEVDAEALKGLASSALGVGTAVITTILDSALDFKVNRKDKSKQRLDLKADVLAHYYSVLSSAGIPENIAERLVILESESMSSSPQAQSLMTKIGEAIEKGVNKRRG